MERDLEFIHILLMVEITQVFMVVAFFFFLRLGEKARYSSESGKLPNITQDEKGPVTKEAEREKDIQYP